MCIPHPEFYYSSIVELENRFGLGFEDNKGNITHHLWINNPEDEGKNGHYKILWMIYDDLNDFIELLSLMKSLSDQVNTFKFTQPPGLQIQDILKRPFRTCKGISRREHKNQMTAKSWSTGSYSRLVCSLSDFRIPRMCSLKFVVEIRDTIERFFDDSKTGYHIEDRNFDQSIAGCASQDAPSEISMQYQAGKV